MKKKANATLYSGGSNLVTLGTLAKVETPAGTPTWTPIPHSDVPAMISTLVEERGWEFVDGKRKRFQIALTPDSQKMFGVTKIRVPDCEVDPEFDMALGFRNSHNKTLALRTAVGRNVMVCDNLDMAGDIDVRREHTKNITVRETLELAMDSYAEKAKIAQQEFNHLRETKLQPEEGLAFLVDAVKAGALPLVDLMKARDRYLQAYSINAYTPDALKGTDCTTLHGDKLWCAYQIVTETWKDRSFYRIPEKSDALRKVVQAYAGDEVERMQFWGWIPKTDPDAEIAVA
tara:strand:- start:70 stop:933 length:864 start_codon:yes stop_codon:yes gene_type:complete